MSWNYRVVERNGFFNIHEVYYDENGVPWSCTAEPSFPQGETLEELQEDTAWYQNALTKPVLYWCDFEEMKQLSGRSYTKRGT